MTSPIAFPFGPGQTTDNVTGLAAGAAKVLGQVGTNQVAVFDWTVAPIQIKTGAGATSGTIDILIATSETAGAPPGGNWTSGIDPTLATDQSSVISGMLSAATINVAAAGATTYKANAFGIYATLGFIPMFWTLIIRNNTGLALDATPSSFIFMYSQLNFSLPVPIVYA